MSKDQMADVFPVLFDFKKGESTDAEKLTGAVKHIDTAFSGLTQAIGDPWDYQAHSFDLSLENLGVTSLARIIGPSDYLSPLGGCFNEEAATVTLTLRGDRNSWNLGMPLVKLTSPVTESGNVTYTDLDWGTDIVVSFDTDDVLDSRKTSYEEVIQDGDFYVDFKKGVIYAYKTSSFVITLYISNLYAFPAGVPWGTHNVIPTWQETANLCNVTHISDTATLSTWAVTLPIVTYSSRVSQIGKRIGNTYSSSDSAWSYNFPGYGSYYRLPRSITSAGLSIGAAIPEGYIQLWDEVGSRVVPNVLFYYRDDNSLTITTPYSVSGYLTAGTNYRILTSGTSISEAISYLMATQRYNKHAGLDQYANTTYTLPISHNDLDNLCAGTLDDIGTIDVDTFKFRKSSYSTNPHPQYIHRAGYMSDDLYGNSANAMRGHLVFAGDIDSSFACGGGTTGGNMYATSGIKWGGGDTSDASKNTTLAFEGGTHISTWTSGNPADRFMFGIMGVGAIPVTGTATERYGALALSPWYGTPLYLRGQSNAGPTSSSQYYGASLGFDLGINAEANYLKLYPGIRSTTYDVPHLAANVNQTSFSVESPIMPSLSNRIAPEQVRELRFRGVSYVSSASNPNSSIGGSSTRGAFSASEITEFKYYYTSPGIIGADFLNVYGNAIFFSDTGDGKSTSFTVNGEDWLNEEPDDYDNSNAFLSRKMPTGIYYLPYKASLNFNPVNVFLFSTYSNYYSRYAQPLYFGDTVGLKFYASLGHVVLSTVNGRSAITSGQDSYDDYNTETTNDDNVYLYADDDIFIQSLGLTNITSSESITLTSTTSSSFSASTSMSLTTGTSSITLTAATSFIASGSVESLIYAPSVRLRSTDYTGIVSIYTGTAPTTTSGQIGISANNSLVLKGSEIYMYPTTVSTSNRVRIQQGSINLIATTGSYISFLYLETAGTSHLHGGQDLSVSAATTLSLTGTSSGIHLHANYGSGNITLYTSGTTSNTKTYISISGGFVEGSTLKIHASGEIYAV